MNDGMSSGNHRLRGGNLLRKLVQLPQKALHWVTGKLQTAAHEKKLLDAAKGLQIDPHQLELLEGRWKWKLGVPGATAGVEAAPPLSREDAVILARIHRERDAGNRNNVTRTAAYWQVYSRRPELHWAFLAHMVSRNGGWCMTDLQGELLPLLLNAEQREAVFSFLERANALIFRDAYPQLLIYEASLEAGRPLFHLLPSCGVSAFMRPLWEQFWEVRCPVMLTIGLIVNEQHYIQKRVVENPFFVRTVLDTLFFNTQSLLQLNQVVFPYLEGERIRLAGLVLEDFRSLRERIEVGRSLYGILFGIPAVQEGARRYAAGRPHSGSRADYWPQLFTPVRQQPPTPPGTFKERMDHDRLRPGAMPLHSPALEAAWRDRPVEPPRGSDWFQELGVLEYFRSISPRDPFEMTDEHAAGFNKIELAVLAGNLLE